MRITLPHILVCATLAALAWLVPAGADAQPFSYQVALVLPPDLRTLLEENLDIVKWRDDTHMDADQLRQVYSKTPDSIRELLATAGYFTPQIVSSLDQTQGEWLARFTVDPGQPVLVSKLDLAVAGAFSDGSKENEARLQKIRTELPLQAGAVFRQSDWEETKRTALKHLLIDRYPAAALVSSKAIVDPATHEAELTIVLNSGPAFSFGDLQIKGLERYPRLIVDRLNPITPGSPYSQAKLLDFQAQLQNTPYFASAMVNIKVDPAAPTAVPIQVDLVEKQAQKLSLGIGASTNTGARGQIGYEDSNFINKAWRMTSLAKIETKAQQLTAGIQVPRTPLGYLDSLSVFNERDDIEGTTTINYGLSAKRARQSGKLETALESKFQSERLSAAGVASTKQQALTLTYSWSRRDVDNPLYPTHGLLFTASVGGALQALLSTTDFLRAYTKMVYFYPLRKDGELILRGELGAVNTRSLQGVPSEFMFRTGGDQSIRGFDYQSLGVNEAGSVVGGRYLGVGSIEYMQWFTQVWGASVFYDTGDAADDPQTFKPVHGYGAGLRWKSPVGPLNLDLAYGREVKKLHLHFSVGFAF